MKGERLLSLDLLRGLDMMVLTLGYALVIAADGVWHFPPAVMRQFAHGWECFTFWDIIMPLFIFMCGAAMPFALPKRLAAGGKVFWRHVLARVALLWFLGGCVQGNWLSLDPQTFGPFANTLQAIAVGYLVVAATMALRRPALMVAVPVVLVAVYSALLAACGGYGQYDNFAFRCDQAIFKAVLPATNFYVSRPDHVSSAHCYTWCLTSCMFAAMTFCGYFATKILQGAGAKGRKAVTLAGCGAALLVVGLVAEVWIPCIKPIFTLSFTAQAMGWCALALATLYALTDILQFRRGLALPILFGQYALVAYMVTHDPFRPALWTLADTLTCGVTRCASPEVKQLVMAAAVTVLLPMVLIAWKRIKTRA